jgi:hypothetical protein
MNSYARSLTLALILAAGPSAGIAQVTPDQTRASDSPATPAAKSAADLQANMQANMQKMHSLMSRLGQTTDPTERRRLLAEHQELMRQQIGAMNQMHGDMGMMGGGMGMMSGPSKDGKAASGTPPCEMTEMRMEMMTGMMEQMLLHQEAEESSPPKP